MRHRFEKGNQINKGRIPSKETRVKMRLAQLGKKMSDEFCKKLSIRNKGNQYYKHKKKFKHTEETKEKLRLITGSNTSNWKGGISRDTQHYCRQRRARKFEAIGNHTLGEWETLKAQYNWTCPWCKSSEPEIKLSEDHIIPLVKGGSDNIENIQPLCRRCNSKKGSKIFVKGFPIITQIY